MRSQLLCLRDDPHFLVLCPDGDVYVEPPWPSLWYVEPLELL
jgi:hypothetical protein